MNSNSNNKINIFHRKGWINTKESLIIYGLKGGRKGQETISKYLENIVSHVDQKTMTIRFDMNLGWNILAVCEDIIWPKDVNSRPSFSRSCTFS